MACGHPEGSGSPGGRIPVSDACAGLTGLENVGTRLSRVVVIVESIQHGV